MAVSGEDMIGWDRQASMPIRGRLSRYSCACICGIISIQDREFRTSMNYRGCRTFATIGVPAVSCAPRVLSTLRDVRRESVQSRVGGCT